MYGYYVALMIVLLLLSGCGQSSSPGDGAQAGQATSLATESAGAARGGAEAGPSETDGAERAGRTQDATLQPSPSTIVTPTPMLVSEDADLRRYVLRLEDLPGGFVPDLERCGLASNEYTAASTDDPHTSVTELVRQGRVVGYSATYWRRGMEMTFGLAAVRSWAVVMESVAAAEGYLERQFESSIEVEDTLPMSVDVLGDESAAFAWQYTDSDYTYQSYEVLFRKGNLFCAVQTIGTVNTYGASEAIALARKMAERVARGEAAPTYLPLLPLPAEGDRHEPEAPGEAETVSETTVPGAIETPVTAGTDELDEEGGRGGEPEVTVRGGVAVETLVVADDSLLIGVVRNDTAREMLGLDVSVRLYRGNTIVSENDGSGLPVLGAVGAGEWAPFSVRLGDVEWDRCRVTIGPQEWFSMYVPAREIQVVATELSTRGVVRGELLNTGDGVAAEVRVAIAGYAADGKLVAVGQARAEASSLAPGEGTLFEVDPLWNWEGDAAAVEAYKIRVVKAIE